MTPVTIAGVYNGATRARDADRESGLCATPTAAADGQADADGDWPQRRPRHEQSRRPQRGFWLQRIGLVRDWIVNHAERGQRPRRGVLGGVLDATEGEPLHARSMAPQP